MAKGFDCATKLNSESAKTLKAAGYEYVARYLGDNWKSFNVDEARAICEAGLQLVSVYETNPTNVSYFIKAQGIADAKAAHDYAKAVGQPDGSTIYFTVDYDTQSSHMDEIDTYLDGIKETLKDYKIGLYAEYDIIVAFKGKVDYYWQTYAWSHGNVAEFVHMYQYQNGVVDAGVQLDRNEIKKEPGAWMVQIKVPKKEAPKPVGTKDEAYMHIVVSGETLSGIASKYGVTLDYLVKLNNIHNPDLIYPGQRIKLKGSVAAKPVIEYYTVKKGDTLSEIATAKHTTISQLVAWNKIKNPNLIYPGQKIRVK